MLLESSYQLRMSVAKRKSELDSGKKKKYDPLSNPARTTMTNYSNRTDWTLLVMTKY